MRNKDLTDTSISTPGPWQIRSDDRGAVYARGIIIARMMGINSSRLNVERQRANARLMAAAPDLLDALYAALQGHKGWDDEARAAIAKAEGK